ncbi:unnamed protein product [Sympodiomycopsis kandeliae]
MFKRAAAIVALGVACATSLCTLAAPATSLAERQSNSLVGYLFIHFYDNYTAPGDYTTYPAGEQIFGHISNGNDALSYKPLKGGAPLLTSNVGTKGVRDMYLASKDDQSQHYLIATDLNQTAVGGFGGKFLSRSLVIWDSQGSSLTKWSAPRLVEVVPPEFRMAWAPEAIWLAEQNRFMVYWSSNKFTDAQHSGNPDNDKIYRAYTTDFKTFTTPEVYIDLKTEGVIDLTIHKTAEPNQYVRFFKGESVFKCRGQVSNDGLDGTWTNIGNGVQYTDEKDQSEACLFFKSNTEDLWYVFLDQYGKNPPGYYPYKATNGITNYGYESLGFPQGMPTMLKHGVVKPLTQAQYDDVSKNWA